MNLSILEMLSNLFSSLWRWYKTCRFLRRADRKFPFFLLRNPPLHIEKKETIPKSHYQHKLTEGWKEEIFMECRPHARYFIFIMPSHLCTNCFNVGNITEAQRI